MVSNSTMKIDQNCTLNKMLGENNDIEIPIIQRDYAQGRASAKEIRDDFLKDLFDHLVNNEKIKLSFVYGAIRETTTKKIYIPYDGQQRITLIYLLSLYMAARCSDWAEIAKLSRFKYYTRDYSTEFCTFLTNNDDREEQRNCIFKRIDFFSKDRIIDQIENDIAFFAAWKFDPTATSMMVVLESIHVEFMSRFGKSTSEEQKEFARNMLCELNNGCVFFDWCTINASDNIYIKMNGRGKPLSAFDNFKNTLYAELDKLRKQDEEKGRTDRTTFLKEFEVKMDGEWTDMFWNLRSKLSGDTENYNIAPFMMNFLFFVFELKYTEKTTRFYFSKTRQYFPWIDEKNVVSFLSLFKEKCKATDNNPADVSLDDYIWLSKLLDILKYRIGNDKVVTEITEIDGYTSEYYLLDEVSTEKIRKKTDSRYLPLSAESSIVAAMYFEYLVNVSSFDKNGKFLVCYDTYRGQWLQLIGRAMKTARLYKGRFDALQRDKHIFESYIKYFVPTVINKSNEGNLISAAPEFSDQILDNMKNGFDASHVYSQVYEEIFKYKLIANDNKWEKRIKKAEEQLPYFDNQIYFLFKLAEDINGSINEKKFDDYLQTMKNITDEHGIKTNYENMFSAILLSFEDYRVRSEEGYGNAEGLCSNKSTENFKWRHFFDLISDKADIKLSALKKTLDLILEKDSIEKAHETVTQQSTGERWRDIIIRYPQVLSEVENQHRIVYKDDNENWYLINSAGVAKQVHVTSLNDSINLDLYGIFQEAGYADMPGDLKNGRILELSSTNNIIISVEALGNDKFKVKYNNDELKNSSYNDTVNSLKEIRSRIPT